MKFDHLSVNFFLDISKNQQEMIQNVKIHKEFQNINITQCQNTDCQQ